MVFKLIEKQKSYPRALPYPSNGLALGNASLGVLSEGWALLLGFFRSCSVILREILGLTPGLSPGDGGLVSSLFSAPRPKRLVVCVTEGVWLFPSVLLRFSLLPGSACVHRFCPLPVPGISLQFDFLPGAVQRPAAACELCKRSHLTSSPSPELSPSPGEVAEFVSERP